MKGAHIQCVGVKQMRVTSERCKERFCPAGSISRYTGQYTCIIVHVLLQIMHVLVHPPRSGTCPSISGSRQSSSLRIDDVTASLHRNPGS